MPDLASRQALPDGTAPRLSEAHIEELLLETPGWEVENGTLTREVQVKNFRAALALVNEIGQIAEQQNHHPDIAIFRWNHVRVELYTHTVEGLSENDFIMAAKFSDVLAAP